jgi:2-dehydro-3-deoxy-D-arabinonate dehydratase
LKVSRGGAVVFEAAISTSEMKRSIDVLVEYLGRHQTFAFGCILLTGTGIVPPADFTLQAEDSVEIEIAGIGVLRNQVERPAQPVR